MKVSDVLKNMMHDISLVKNDNVELIRVTTFYIKLIMYLRTQPITDREAEVLRNIRQCLYRLILGRRVLPYRSYLYN